MKIKVFLREMVLPFFWLYFILVVFNDQPLHRAVPPGYASLKKENRISFSKLQTLIPLPEIYLSTEIRKLGNKK